MGAVFWMSQMLMRGKGQTQETKSKRRVKRRTSSFIEEMLKGWVYVKRSSLMQWMSVAAILFSILYFSIALPFSKSATLQYPNENELASFLGLFNGVTTAAAFLTSIFFANRLYARFGIMNIILALPLIYLLGFSGLILFNTFFVIVIFRFVQMLWLSGMADAAYQTMFSAVPPEKRDQVNAFLNGIPEQAGVFLAGGILIIGEQSFTSAQLYVVGLITAIATALIIWRATPAYRKALVSSLQEGRPTIFDKRGTTYDSTFLQVALENIKHPDPIVRHVSAEMLSEMNQPDVLISTLQDENINVRIASLKGLSNHAPAVGEVSALLADPEPALRAQAVQTLTTFSLDQNELQNIIEPLLNDESTQVQLETAFGLLKIENHLEAIELIQNTCLNGGLEERIHALRIISKLNYPEFYELVITQIDDPNPLIRSATARVLTTYQEKALPSLLELLADYDSAVRESAAIALSQIGNVATSHVINVLDNSLYTNGALLALSRLPVYEHHQEIKAFASKKMQSALYYDHQAQNINPLNAHLSLLRDSLHSRSQVDGIHALLALSLLHDYESIQVAIENLKSKSATQRANALETLEAVRDSKTIKPLLHIWEITAKSNINKDHINPQVDYAQIIWAKLMQDDDDWIRACAIFVYESFNAGGEIMDTRTALTVMDRILLLRQVPLFADLSPIDLQQIAKLSSEHHAEAGEVVFEEGEIGEEMYVIVHGEVKVMIRQSDGTEKEIAKRKIGDVLGEMSIISGEPRSASVIAAEETHFLCLDKKTFESLMRERPEVGFAVMRVLCQRLTEATK
ncbi:MAG: cyclic nucleotide-binding domain-containing protein [Anaerolineales bacterium]|nr:cyclic nucleotide-binding domain-containing protein [Anaerolineales bacterium]